LKITAVSRKWLLYNPDPALVAQLSKEHNVSHLVATVMANRGLTPCAAAKYLSPTLSTMYDPSGMHQMGAAADRFADAIIKGEICFCVGDFDADGTNATAILLRFGKMLGYEIHPYIPDRIKEGYGLSEDALRFIQAAGASLVLTVDLGVTAVKEAKICKELGMDLVITDHHAVNEDGILPDAVAVVNPHIESSYPYQHLSGAGVAFALVVATLKVLRDRGYFHKRSEPKVIELLPFVALATIADLVELKSENRLFVTHGLKTMYSIPGLKALAQVSGLDVNTPPFAGQIGFRLGPRINASGRMSSAATALELLTTDSPARAEELAGILDRFNQERQAEELRVVTEALAMLEADPELLNGKTIVLAGDFAPGVIGIAASRLTEMFHRPTIIISDRQDGTGKGSCRSISAFHMRQGLGKCSLLLAGFGGHPMAAGLSLKMSDLEAFKEAFEKAAAHLTEDDLRPVTRIDAELVEDQITVGTVDELEQLQPFGMGNAGPVFCAYQASVISLNQLKEKHLKLNLMIGGTRFTALGWGMADREHEIEGMIDAAFTLDINEWRGERTIQLILKDFTPSASAF
jgi:single-stranded-DNA-specific exonuclease